MDDLISRSALLAEFPIDLDKPMYHVTGIRATIGVAPAVEAEPVVHAHWMFYEDATGDWWDKCSGCGGKIPNEGGYCCDLPRCPHCGAHMNGGNEDR